MNEEELIAKELDAAFATEHHHSRPLDNPDCEFCRREQALQRAHPQPKAPPRPARAAPAEKKAEKKHEEAKKPAPAPLPRREPEPQPEPLKPAVPVKKSVTPDYIVCLEDGKKFKSLKRHLRTQYNVTPEEYREKWGLPKSYPMVAPAYAAARSVMAKAIGLGQGGRQPAKAAPPAKPAKAKRAPKA